MLGKVRSLQDSRGMHSRRQPTGAKGECLVRCSQQSVIPREPCAQQAKAAEAHTHCRKRALAKNFPKLEVFRAFLARLWWQLGRVLLQRIGAWSGFSCGAVHGGSLPATTTRNARGRAGLSLGPHH